MEGSRPQPALPRGFAQALLGLALAWLGFAVLRLLLGPPPATALEKLDAGLPLLLPLALAVLMAGLLRRPPPVEDDDRLAVATAEAQALQAALAELETSLAAASAGVKALAASAGTESKGLVAQSRKLAESAAIIAQGSSTATATAGQLATSLPALSGALDTLRAGLGSLAEDAGVQLRAVEAMLGRVATENADATTRADASLAQLVNQFSRLDEVSRASTDAMAKRAYALDAAVDGVLARSDSALVTVESRLGTLLSQIEAGLETGTGQLGRIGDESARRFVQRLDTLTTAARALESILAGHDAITERLAARLAESEATGMRMAEPIAGLAEAGSTLATSLDLSLAAASDSLAGLLEATDGVRTQAEDIATGEARLQALVARLEIGLADAGLGLAALEAAARAAGTAGEDAAGRIEAPLSAILAAITETQGRLDTIETRLVTRERDTTARDADALLSALGVHVGDLARLLDLPVPESQWAAWLKGDRSVLPRTVLALLNEDQQRLIARHLAYDPQFRTLAQHFLDRFEALITRLLGDRDGDALAATMLTSDLGKLYVRLGEAAGRHFATETAATQPGVEDGATAS